MFKRGGVWWINIRHNGRRIQKSLDTANKKLAERIGAKIRLELAEGIYFEKIIGAKKTVAEMMEKFMEEHAPKVSKGMQKSYRVSKKHILKFFGEMTLKEVTPKQISRYKMQRLAKKRKPATVNREIAVLSKAFSLAFKEWEWVLNNPVAKISREKENNLIDRWLTYEEEKALLAKSPEWLREIFIFALNTGMRKGEILSLAWKDVDLFRKVLIVRETKNKTPRTIPLNKAVMELLKQKAKVRQLQIHFVFHSQANSRLMERNLSRAFYRALELSEVKDFRFHDLRHTFATRLAQNGIDLYKISKLLGHKDITTTQRYAHHCPESLREGVEVLDERFGYNLATVSARTWF